ncbi:threonine synthase [Elstera cyanobacteriorum]|uniref:threonine synthase n=1 Tax=Elstera cyanobacteriorum TaxID=2022747 RepID=UPI002352F1D5|nr:threonine synthase [Elstera cyanobacteriorum]MCK6441165.1 threonine synthase [Elstera cyanobacteriorum]
MRYVSTRGAAPDLAFDDLLLTGLARDGGLYVPAEWPSFTLADWRALRGLSYADLATRLLAPYVCTTISEDDLSAIVHSTYEGFRHPAVAPLKQLDTNSYMLELFHGPTIAFKDYALQLLGRLFDNVLARQGKRVTILGATSGDTGSAAIEACRDRDAVDVFILYPHGRVSDVQRRQMTTVAAKNVRAIAVEGTFDDCQDIVKALFADLQFRDAAQLSAANSINWARIVAQIVYYVYAALQLGAPDRHVNFAVPTGNFGNVFAAYCAKRMGLPIDRLVIGTNRNDILTRFFTEGDMSIHGVEPSLSPSMDIQVSSNFERLLFDLLERDGPEVAKRIAEFRETGKLTLEKDRLKRAQQLFAATRLSDEETLATIRRVYETTGEVLDPHSAIAVGSMQQLQGKDRDPMVALACAHPAKFPAAVKKALGFEAPLPAHLAHLMTAQERFTVLPAKPEAIRDFVSAELRLGAFA